MEKPNILWICTDQQRFDTIHYLGNDMIHTPHLDRLCREGVAFTNAYCQNPVCSPSRASFLTGKYPSQIGITANGQQSVPKSTELITSELNSIGYRCGLVGKLHLASPKDGVEERCDDSYTSFHYSHDPWYGTIDDNEYLKWLLDIGGDFTQLFNHDAGSRRGYSEKITAEKHQTTWCAQKAIECIDEWEHDGSKDPWLLSLNIFDTNPPFDAPLEYSHRYNPDLVADPLFKESDLSNQKALEDAYHQSARHCHAPDGEVKKKKANYYGMIELIDEQLGRILEYLDTHDLREHTLIIFQSDHGEMLGDHGLILKGARFYEGATKVPLIWSLPGVIKENQIYDSLVELRDIVPTLREMVGIQVGPGSLWKVLTNDNKGPIRDHIICEYHDSLWPEFACKEAIHHTTIATMYRDERYKIIVYHTQEVGELYDLEEDPFEFNNLWNDSSYQRIQTQLMMSVISHYVESFGPKTPVIWSF